MQGQARVEEAEFGTGQEAAKVHQRHPDSTQSVLFSISFLNREKH